MTSWTHKSTIIGGRVLENDRVILRDHEEVGRVYLGPETPNVEPWVWATWVHPPQQGRSASMGEALDAARMAVGKLNRL